MKRTTVRAPAKSLPRRSASLSDLKAVHEQIAELEAEVGKLRRLLDLDRRVNECLLRADRAHGEAIGHLLAIIEVWNPSPPIAHFYATLDTARVT